jgi:uncharacterized protein (TIGR02453 family)
MTFDGFSKEGLRFLTTLGSKDKAWFDANRKTYETEIVAPTKAFVADLGEALAQTIFRSLVAQPKTNGSIAPINNDVRFSKDKSPYKDHLLLKFWEGADKKMAPTLHVRLSEKSVGFATGVMFGSVDRWRELIDDSRSGGALADALAELSQGRALDIAGQELKRVPKPYAGDHPRADLLRHKGFQARWPETTPPEVHSGAFVDWCATRLSACAAIHRWLVKHSP